MFATALVYRLPCDGKQGRPNPSASLLSLYYPSPLDQLIPGKLKSFVRRPTSRVHDRPATTEIPIIAPVILSPKIDQ